MGSSKFYYSKPLVISSAKEPVFQKNPHLSKDIKMVLFNEKYQVNTVVRLSDIIRKIEEKQTCSVDVEDIPHVKIDLCVDSAEKDLQCFDFAQDQYLRVYTIAELYNKSLQ